MPNCHPSPSSDFMYCKLTLLTVLSTRRADFQNLLHPLLHVTHLQIMSQQRSQFSTQNLLQMENVDTN